MFSLDTSVAAMNARWITERGKKGLGKIAISTALAGNNVQIRIQDSGGGYLIKSRIGSSNRFFTTKIRGKGTGQGMAISRRIIVDKHNGTLSFETKPGSGTIFMVELPVA